MNSHNEVLENGSEMWMLAGSIVLWFGNWEWGVELMRVNSFMTGVKEDADNADYQNKWSIRDSVT